MKFTVIHAPLITEKAISLTGEGGRYTFLVDRRATKGDVAKAVQEMFKVRVKDVHTLILRGKARRFGRYQGQSAGKKKAIVSLEKGQTIDLFEGGAEKGGS